MKKVKEVIGLDTVEKFPDMPVEKKSEYIDQALIIDEFIPIEICDEKQIEDIIKTIAKEEELEISKSNQGKFMKILKADYNVNMKVVSNVYKRIAE